MLNTDSVTTSAVPVAMGVAGDGPRWSGVVVAEAVEAGAAEDGRVEEAGVGQAVGEDRVAAADQGW